MEGKFSLAQPFWADCRQERSRRRHGRWIVPYRNFDPIPRNFRLAGDRPELDFWFGECFGDKGSLSTQAGDRGAKLRFLEPISSRRCYPDRRSRAIAVHYVSLALARPVLDNRVATRT